MKSDCMIPEGIARQIYCAGQFRDEDCTLQEQQASLIYAPQNRDLSSRKH